MLYKLAPRPDLLQSFSIYLPEDLPILTIMMIRRNREAE